MKDLADNDFISFIGIFPECLLWRSISLRYMIFVLFSLSSRRHFFLLSRGLLLLPEYVCSSIQQVQYNFMCNKKHFQISNHFLKKKQLKLLKKQFSHIYYYLSGPVMLGSAIRLVGWVTEPNPKLFRTPPNSLLFFLFCRIFFFLILFIPLYNYSILR